ncbi:DUF1173 family protein [Klebsiella pneumoniae]|uniref:DUF1173 family protein n=1 Tax=Klebsiella pneumoniae TaxID=573 RepID=UPI00210E4C56|nr:DUF1173 family protein [Klebsiella pneumoniae]
MYIAKIGENFVLKRMPNSADQHDFSCLSYEPPTEISGLGEVIGEAIKTDETGASVLKLSSVCQKAMYPNKRLRQVIHLKIL